MNEQKKKQTDTWFDHLSSWLPSAKVKPLTKEAYLKVFENESPKVMMEACREYARTAEYNRLPLVSELKAIIQRMKDNNSLEAKFERDATRRENAIKWEPYRAKWAKEVAKKRQELIDSIDPAEVVIVEAIVEFARIEAKSYVELLSMGPAFLDFSVDSEDPDAISPTASLWYSLLPENENWAKWAERIRYYNTEGGARPEIESILPATFDNSRSFEELKTLSPFEGWEPGTTYKVESYNQSKARIYDGLQIAT